MSNILFRENISNSDLIFCKEVDWFTAQKIYGFNSAKLEVALLDRIETRNRNEYQYLMMLLANGLPEYTIYSEVVEIEKQSGGKIGGISIRYKLEKIKCYAIYAYEERKDKNIRNIEIVDSLSKSEFEQKALDIISQYILGKSNSYQGIFERIQAIVANVHELTVEEVDKDFEVIDWVDNYPETYETILSLEDEFNVVIPDTVSLITLKDIVGYINKNDIS